MILRMCQCLYLISKILLVQDFLLLLRQEGLHTRRVELWVLGLKVDHLLLVLAELLHRLSDPFGLLFHLQTQIQSLDTRKTKINPQIDANKVLNLEEDNKNTFKL